MKKAFLIGFIIILLLAITVYAGTINIGNIEIEYHLIKKEVAGVKYTPICLSECHLPLRIKYTGALAPATKSLTKSDLSYYKSKILGLNNIDFSKVRVKYLKNQSISQNRPIYECYNYVGSIPEGCNQIGWDNFTSYELVWKNLPSSITLQKDKWYYIDIIFYRPASTRFSAIDVVPKVFNKDMPDLAWFNASFSKCKNITIENTDGATLTNYQVYINVSYDSDMQADFDDLRFSNESCNNAPAVETGELDYWIENKLDSSYIDVWVEVDTISGSSNRTISMYYDCGTCASVGDGYATFPAFDHFTSWNTTKWGSEPAHSSIVGGTYLRIIDNGGDSNLFSDEYFGVNYSIRTYVNRSVYGGSCGASQDCTVASINWRNSTGWDEVFYHGFDSSTGAVGNTWRYNTNGQYSNYGSDTNGWVVHENRRYDTSRCWANTWEPANENQNRTTSLPTANLNINIRNVLAQQSHDLEQMHDWIFVRKYILQEPTHSFGAEESSSDPPPMWSNNATTITTPYDGSTVSEFNISWTNATSVKIELNDTGTPTNCTASNTYGGDVWNCTQIIGANFGNDQYWKSYGTNASGTNTTPSWNFTVARATNPVDIYINNGTEYKNQNVNITYPTQTNASAYCVGCELWRSDFPNAYINASSENNTLTRLGVAPTGITWDYMGNSSGTMNYSSNTSMGANRWNLTVAKGTANISLYLNGTQGNKYYSNNSLANFTFESAGTLQQTLTTRLYSNISGFGIVNNTSTFVHENLTTLSGATAEAFNMTAVVEGNTNYSGASIEYNAMLTTCENTSFFFNIYEESDYTTTATARLEANFDVWNATNESDNDNQTFYEPYASVHELCINFAVPLRANATIRYWNASLNGTDVYTTRFYYYVNASFTAGQNNVSLYIMNSSQTINTTVQVKNEVGMPEANVIVKAQKYLIGNNTYISIAMIKTDYKGQGVLELKPNEWYKFTLEQDNIIKNTYLDIYLTPSDTELTFSITSVSIPVYWSYHNKMAWNVSVNETSGVITAMWDDTSGKSQTMELNATEIGALVWSSVCANSSTSSSGTLICTVATGGNRTYTWQFTGTYDSGTQKYIYSSGSFTYLLQTPLGLAGVFLAFVIVLILGLAGSWNPATAVLLPMVGVFISFWIGLLSFEGNTILILSGYAFACGIILYRLRT